MGNGILRILCFTEKGTGGEAMISRFQVLSALLSKIKFSVRNLCPIIFIYLFYCPYNSGP